jgi:hypothetical protein
MRENKEVKESEESKEIQQRPEGTPMTTFKAPQKIILPLIVGLATLAFTAPPASAAGGVWSVHPVYAPAHFPPSGGSGELIVTAANLGAEAINASAADPIQIGAQLPAGVKATFIENYESANFGTFGVLPSPTCEQATLTCEATGGSLAPYQSIEIVIDITVEGAIQPGSRVGLSVSGGGANTAVSDQLIPLSSTPLAFGIERFEQVPLNADGSIDTQAGSHPFQFTTTFTFNQGTAEHKVEEGLQGGKKAGEEELTPAPLAMVKELSFDLPPGLVGDPEAVPQCPIDQFQANECQADTAVGVELTTVAFHGLQDEGGNPQPNGILSLLYNLTPSLGEPARFGFLVNIGFAPPIPIYLNTALRTGSDYGVVVTVHNIPQATWFTGSQLSIWGDPGDPRHNLARNCLGGRTGTTCTPAGESEKQTPFLTLPTSCTGLSNPFTASMGVSTWEQRTTTIPSTYTLHNDAGTPLGLTGCNRLGFEPSLSVVPDGQAASTPSGLTVDQHIDQDEIQNPNGLAPSDVKDVTAVLPEGVVVNPAGADGLEACSEGQVGFQGVEPATGTDLFTSTVESPFCPTASKIGTVKVKTPLLPNPLEGAVYLAAQNANPFGSLIAMYIVAEDPVSGVLLKLPGEVSLSASGQVTATFENLPQAPFEDAEFHFFGGERAPLATPAHCGSYTAGVSFTPWSGTETVNTTSSFEITSGPSHSACPGAALPFAPALTAGTVNNQAGSFSPFTMTMSREDGQQNLKSIQLRMPPGLSGVLTGIPLCAEAQADAGTCSAASLLGETTVSVGLGGNPYTVKGGQVFLTGPYEGAPFGLSIVNPAAAGPFNLGEVIVRAKLEVNPVTAAVTVTSDSSGPYAIPPSIDGIPLEIKHVNVTIGRPGFTFNPTNCTPSAVTGTLDSIEGATQTLSVPYQATNCAALKFAPKFTVSSSGRTSKANGASLTTKVAEPNEPFGSQANIARVKVELPKQLPSRLTTLQKACTNAQFEANPAACPSASKIGYAVVHTPLVPVPLTGPAIFVSHGGEAFPSLTMVLQGYGVTVDLIGTTFISKAGVTSTTFKTVPDQPFSTFELTLPEGKYSALTALGNLCTEKLVMPTEFVGQNGMELHQSTKIGVTGCAKKKSLTRAQKLAAALKACHKKAKGKRASCEKRARKKYGPVRPKKKKK